MFAGRTLLPHEVLDREYSLPILEESLFAHCFDKVLSDGALGTHYLAVRLLFNLNHVSRNAPVASIIELLNGNFRVTIRNVEITVGN
jgi:hypothetical protein